MFASISSNQNSFMGTFGLNSNNNTNAAVQNMQALQQAPQAKPVQQSQSSQQNNSNFSGDMQQKGTNNPANLGNNVDAFA